MGFASLYPSYKTHLRIPVARSARGMRLAMPSKTKRAQESRVPSAPAIVRTSMQTADYRCAGAVSAFEGKANTPCKPGDVGL